MSTWFVDGIKKIRNDDIIIAFIGPTGAGKSYYIDLLTGQPGRRAGHTLSAATTQVEAVRVKHSTYNDRVVLVDTPGIDNTARSSMQVLQMTSSWLQKTYKQDIKLSGLVYLHRITDNRLTEPLENLRMFRELCGDITMTQVILVSTMWEELVVDEGASREKDLEELFWKPLIDKGSRLDRLLAGDPKEAWRIVNQLIRRNDARGIERMQEDLKELEETLQESYAGRTLQNSLQKALAEQRTSLRQLLFQSQKGDDPALTKKLRKEYTRSEEQTRKTLEDIRKLKISVGREVMTVFCRKEIRAKAVKLADS
ncbi:hypothetical protein P691DRAFT_725161 [Macrolepiota fuliginosa MF-IS2]|uniref:G domain-containing protein n=1 Tax=Macrolepiota fuliginosa MF-IS2 TaxID=1400762 RepID=A0A9P6C6J0_9AGAR|nr:hypothetical protein P691DRAFT_725161 [Macrolepiota fuliginosa MF-IS2]